MIVVNGEQQPDVASVAALLERLGVGTRGVAVALDGEVVPRSQWTTRSIEPGAHVEVVRAVQGG